MALIAVAPPFAPSRDIPFATAVRLTTPTQAVAAAAGVLVLGTLLAILTTPDPLWWHLHFSRLGTFREFSGYSFNAAIVGASAMLVLFAVRLRMEMRQHAGTAVLTSRRAAHVVPTLVGLIGIHLSLVGFAPLDVNLFIHERGSSGAVLSFASLLVSSRWMLRGMHRRVTIATRRVGVSLVFWGVLFGFGVVNLAAFEFIVFSLMFAWLVVVTRQLGVPSDEPDRTDAPPAQAQAPPRTAVRANWPDVHVVSAARALPTGTHEFTRRGGCPTVRIERRHAHRHDAGALPRRGCRASAAPPGSAPSTRSARRSRRSRAAAR